MAGLATAQTIYTLDAHGDCRNPNTSACYEIYYGTVPMSFEAPMPEPFYYPSVIATFTTGLSVPISFHTGNLHPNPAPQSGVGQGTFKWSDGGGNGGTFTFTIYCSFDSTGFPSWAVNCNGSDTLGNSVTFTHDLFVSEGRYGYWSWFDHHGMMTLTLVN